MAIEVSEDVDLGNLLNGSLNTGSSSHIDLSWIGHLISWLLDWLYHITLILLVLLVAYLIVVYFLLRRSKGGKGGRRDSDEGCVQENS